MLVQVSVRVVFVQDRAHRQALPAEEVGVCLLDMLAAVLGMEFAAWGAESVDCLLLAVVTAAALAVGLALPLAMPAAAPAAAPVAVLGPAA